MSKLNFDQNPSTSNADLSDRKLLEAISDLLGSEEDVIADGKSGSVEALDDQKSSAEELYPGNAAAVERSGAIDDVTPKFTKTGDREVTLSSPAFAPFVETFGTKSYRFAETIAKSCGSLTTNANKLEDANAAIAIIKELAPRDGVESMLAAQMAAVHLATMKHAGQMLRAKDVVQQEAYDRTTNRLARTFTAQMEALRKHRTGGQQTVRVERVEVKDGGQAIVGDVNMGAGKKK